MTQRSKRAEVAAIVVGLILVGIGLAAWLSQYYTFDFGGTSQPIIDEPAGTEAVEGGCLVYEDGRLEEVPEGSVQTCSVDGARGICAIGMSTCLNREWTACKSQFVSTEEDCNRVDDDCDGTVDEGCS